MCLDDLKDRYVNFYTDYAFKRFFGTEANKELLISFLNEVLRGREEIEDIEFLPTEQKTGKINEKRPVFDIYCKRKNSGERFMVEMQKGEQTEFMDRTLYYATFPIRDQVQRGGGWNYTLSNIYSINILNFTIPYLREDSKQYIHRLMLTDEETKKFVYEKLQFVYIEMPKFKKKLHELEDDLDRWLYAIKHLSKLRNMPEGFENKVFERLFRQAEISQFTSDECSDYETSLKDMRDYESAMETKERKGRERGRKEGRKEGIEEGRKDVAQNLLAMGMDIETVSKASKLTIEEIRKLQGNKKI